MLYSVQSALWINRRRGGEDRSWHRLIQALYYSITLTFPTVLIGQVFLRAASTHDALRMRPGLGWADISGALLVLWHLTDIRPSFISSADREQGLAE